MTINFNGLATGMDTGALIDQLVAAEKSPASTLTTYQAALGRQATVVTDLSSKLGALADLARGMDLPSEIRSRAVSTSDAKLGVAVSGTSAVGSHAVRVGQLASAQVAASRSFATDAAGVAGDGSIAVTVGGVQKTVAWTSADSLSDIAARINSSATGATASVLFDGTSYHVVMSSSASGAAGAATFTDGGAGLGMAVTVAAKNLQMTIDGIAITRSSNVVADAVPGVTFTAKAVHAVTDGDTLVGITSDTSAVTDKVGKLIDGFNAVAKVISGQLSYNGTGKGIDTLFGDTTLRILQGRVAKMMTSEYGGHTLRDFGIKLDATGGLTLDKAAFTAAMDKDPEAIEALFASGGLSTSISDLGDAYTKSTDGILAAKSAALTARQKVYQDQIDQINDNADKLGDTLRAQFSALEQSVSLMQGQMAYLSRLTG